MKGPAAADEPKKREGGRTRLDKQNSQPGAGEGSHRGVRALQLSETRSTSRRDRGVGQAGVRGDTKSREQRGERGGCPKKWEAKREGGRHQHTAVAH